ncbi:MAG: HAMP domain-containing histidine kinase [Synergistaceae bacterium]|nr:HAMP domain-containing histidine kinase [Synergistaceae bacterium]
MLRKRISEIKDAYFDENLDLSVQAFNLLGFAGIAAGVVIGVFSVVAGTGAVNVLGNFSASALAAFLLIYTRRTGRYHAASVVTVIAVFIVAFPAMFFAAGGYHSGMSCFFVFAVLFTEMMLKGREAAFFVAAEFALYSGCVVAAWRYPGLVLFFDGELYFAADVIAAFIVSSVILLAVLVLYFRIYDNRQRLLDEQNERLKQLDRMKTEFLGNVSHELRTPLTAVSGYAQTAALHLASLPKSPDVMAAAEKLEIIAGQAERLGAMVNQVLDMTRIEEGRMAWNFEPCRVDRIIRETVRAHFPILSKNENELLVRTDPELPEVLADAPRISEVVLNILANAVRHTRRGSITVTAERLDAGGIAVNVTDTGEGISPKRLPHVFERYNRPDGNDSLRGDDTGTGLGLYVSKLIVKAHGGEISAESEPGNGTSIRFTLPM